MEVSGQNEGAHGWGQEINYIASSDGPNHLAHPNGGYASTEGLQRSGKHGQQPQDDGTGQLAHAQGREAHSTAERRLHAEPAHGGDVDDTPEPRFPRAGESRPAAETWDETRMPKSQRRSGISNGWTDYEWIECTDGKARRVKPGIRLLVDGVSGRVARLRALGNAVVPQVVEKIGRAMMETEQQSIDETFLRR